MQQQPTVVTLPAELVERPGGLPAHCTRHGLPAVRRSDFALQSKVRIEGSRVRQVGIRGALGMAERLGQHAKKVRVTQVKDWPLCQVCSRTRAFWLTVSCTMFFGGLLAVAGSFAVGIVARTADGGPAPQIFVVVVMLGFLLMILSAFPFARGSMARLIGARTAPEGGAVLVVNPSDAFVAGLPPGEGRRPRGQP